jgi:heavy metal sensor kinase
LNRVPGLRMRLTLLYAGFFALILMGSGWLFRQTLVTILQRDAETLLEEEFAAVKSYLKVDHETVRWAYDPQDPEETLAVQSLKQVTLLAAPDGRVIHSSDAFAEMKLEPAQLRQSLAGRSHADRQVRDRRGTAYLLRFGFHQGNLLLAVVRSLESNERVTSEFTRSYAVGVPLVILAVAGLGWLMAGRALAPLNDVSRAARSLTGSNLSLRLVRRGANDELDHLIDAFNAMVDRIENSFNQVRQFSIDASHELRTPLTAVRGQLEVALLTAKTPEQFREAVTTAIEDVDQLSQVVKALLRLSQAESGQVVLERQRVDMGALVARSIDHFQLPAEAGAVRLNYRSQPCTIVGDPLQLQRLVSNLISNALKFTPAGGRISVSVSESAGLVSLVVEDTGRGIAAEHLPQIFDRFFRAPDPSRGAERGLGLGLSFVNWIAKAHQAKVSVDSQPGQGTRFTVEFLAAEPEAEPAPTQDL